MAARRMRIEAPCPSCREREIEYTATDMEIPYFGHVTQLVFECERCGFRHSDFLTATSGKPTRHLYRVTKEDDMMVRVVRSTSGTVRIPELGVLVEPGPASDAYVSNIEGVLVRVERVLKQLQRDAEDNTTREECEKRLDQLRRARAGAFELTFIVDDPYGNSVVAAPGTVVEELPPDVAAELKTGEFTLELSEALRRDASGNGHRTAPRDGDG